MMTKPNKYDPLRDYLKSLSANRWTASFEEIENIISARLPTSAYKYQAFWANEAEPKTHVWKKAWMAAGWEIEQANRERRTITFRRTP